MKCKDCKYWDNQNELVSPEGFEYGNCRRFPPGIIEAIIPTKAPEEMEIGVFPLTEGDIDWCGEFERKEKIPNEA